MKLPQHISGRVVRGKQLGRQLGFPTANIALTGSGIKDGVYAVRVQIGGACKRGVANVGTRPTISDAPERFLEVHLFDFEGDIYEQTIDVELVAYLRPEQKFESVEALRLQIEQDKINANK
jgi:riboflavin kinase/FMN adenylyltransferase